MSSSAEAAVRAVPLPELRSGDWTRLGETAVLGDGVTEHALAGLAESTRRAARSQGFAQGWAEGRQAAAAQAREEAAREAAAQAAAEELREGRLREAVHALERAAAALHGSVAATCDRVEQQASALALALVEEVLGREVRVTTGSDVVRRALSLLPEEPLATVRLSPDLVADAAVEDLAERGVRVVADPSLGRADLVLENDDHVLDLRVAGALDRVREVLA